MAGTKPIALHTEYAKEGAEFQGGFYGPGNDVVFYLVRADQGGGGEGMESGELPTTDDAMLHAMGNGGLDGFPEGTDDDAILFAQANGSLNDLGT